MSPIRRPPELAGERRASAEAIGHRLRAVRQERGMTQRQLAGDRYVPAYISAIERGHAFPSVPALQFIAEQLGTTAAALIDVDRELVAHSAHIRRAWLAEDRVFVELADARVVGLPLARVPNLRGATLDQLGGWTVRRGGRILEWRELGVAIPLETFLEARISESADEGAAPPG